MEILFHSGSIEFEGEKIPIDKNTEAQSLAVKKQKGDFLILIGKKENIEEKLKYELSLIIKGKIGVTK
ncbi:hypothetical protein B6I21_01320 [candidate division KSB1 bacterium 4572_119]|nr:MAG: hypothetical protein B6I21_01320 [candidate division KSB1 bacterium 4572_119]